jgi:hypothetical protein
MIMDMNTERLEKVKLVFKPNFLQHMEEYFTI